MKTARVFFAGLLCLPCLLAAAEIRVPDDHETIQAAIDAAMDGDLVLVSPGTYRERLVLKPGIRVRSAGNDEKGELGLKRAEATIIEAGGGEAEDSDSPGVTMAEGATLDGFTVTGVGTYDEAVWQKNWEEKGANQSHEHIGHFGVPGIAITGVNCTVTNNLVHHIGNTGIAIRGVEGKTCSPVISANFCYRNMGGGIGSMRRSTAIIQGNTCFENFYAGIGHDDADPLVTGNECFGNIRAGIGVSEGACPTVRNNRCYGNRRAGIGIRTGAETRPVIEDNECYENGMAGIAAEEDAAPIIRNNRCYRNELVGIGARDHASLTVVENHCYENKAAGIGVDGSSALLLRNRIEKNAAAGIGISGKSKVTAVENECLDNKLVAVGVPGGGEALLRGNTFARAGGMPPIVAILGGSQVVLADNTIRGGGVAAVMLQGKLTATGNVLEGQNGGAGFLARKDSELTLSGNQISGYKVPVRDQEAKSVVNHDDAGK